MRRALAALIALPVVLAACEPEEIPPDRDQVDTQPGSACGEPVTGIEMSFVGTAQLAAGGPAVGASITLEDRSYPPGLVLGEAVTDAAGRYAFDATEITDWPNCWLTLANYQLVGELDALSGELQVNRDMWNALKDDSFRVDLTSDPLRLGR